MADSKVCYRNLKNYKYQLMKDYQTNIDINADKDIDKGIIILTTDGRLTIKEHYAWDGPSGPTIDTKNFMRGSLVHDVLYQLMREKDLPYKDFRKDADDLLKKNCLEDGMSRLRAWYVHKSVRIFGEKNARPSQKPRDEIICAP